MLGGGAHGIAPTAATQVLALFSPDRTYLVWWSLGLLRDEFILCLDKRTGMIIPTTRAPSTLYLPGNRRGGVACP